MSKVAEPKLRLETKVFPQCGNVCSFIA